jgi:hypothetical protein
VQHPGESRLPPERAGGIPAVETGRLSVIVRSDYVDGKTGDRESKNGVHLADYVREVDVPKSKIAFALRQQEIRYLAIPPERPDEIETIEPVKGKDASARLSWRWPLRRRNNGVW